MTPAPLNDCKGDDNITPDFVKRWFWKNVWADSAGIRGLVRTGGTISPKFDKVSLNAHRLAVGGSRNIAEFGAITAEIGAD